MYTMSLGMSLTGRIKGGGSSANAVWSIDLSGGQASVIKVPSGATSSGPWAINIAPTEATVTGVPN